MWPATALVIVMAALLSLAAVPPASRLARRFGALDQPDDRKLHSGPTPRLGGIAIATGIVGGVVAGFWLTPVDWLERFSNRELLAFVTATAVIFSLGLVDDLVSLSFGKKFVVQVAAAGMLIAAGWGFEILELPLIGTVSLGSIAPLISLLWLVGITNAINLIDGLDGLASGVTALIATSFLSLALVQGHPETVLLSAAMTGACLGFLHHNWAPARVFMGDCGSLTLGFLLAALSLRSSLKAPAAVAVLVPLLALGLPVIDALLVMLVRFLESPGHPVLRRLGMMFRADRRHLHHLVLAMAQKRSRIVLWLYALVLVFCAGSISVAISRSGSLAVVLLLAEVLAVVLIRRLGLQSQARRITVQQRHEIRDELIPDAAGVEAQASRFERSNA